MEAAYRPKPKLNGEVFRKMCEAAGIEDYQLMDMVDQGVSGLDESRPYAIVLNGNYASLAPYYGPVFEKAVKEVGQGQLRRFAVEPEHFTAENVWLPCVRTTSGGPKERSSILSFCTKWIVTHRSFVDHIKSLLFFFFCFC